MSYINPKLNWSASDFVNFDDLNRVENNTMYVAQKLRDSGYYVRPLIHKLDWVMSDIVYAEDLNRIESNIKVLQQAYYVSEEFEELKTDWATLDPVAFDFNNRIEKDIDIINNIINDMKSYFVYCGVCNCGQPRLWQQRFRRPKTWIALPYEKLSQMDYTFTGFVNTSESKADSFSVDNGIYATLLYINSNYNELDNLVGSVE